MKNDELKKLQDELCSMKIQIFKLEKVAAEAGNRRLINLKSKNYPEWNEFEFITRKNGANGPSKAECLQYYSVK